MDLISTRRLSTRLKEGDEEAFKAIYEQYWSKLYSLCFYYSQSKEEAEDMLMEVFASLWNNREKADIDNMEHYLVRSAKNQSLKYILKRQRHRKQIHLLEQQAGICSDADDSPERLLEVKEFEFQIHEQVQSLSEKTKTIFLLNRERGFTYEEIARSQGISVKTVEYHISKALRLLGRYTLVSLIIIWLSLS